MDLNGLRDELKVIHDKRIKLSMLKEQAVAKCQEIEKRYNISSELELKQLLDKAEQDYNNKLIEAQSYINKAQEVLLPYEGLI